MKTLKKAPCSIYPSAIIRTGLFALLMMVVFSSGDLSAQYTGPAFGNIAGGESVSTEMMMNSFPLTDVGEPKVRNFHWEKSSPPLYDDKYNNTPSTGPVGSNVFIDPATGEFPRQTSDPPGVMIDFEGVPDRGRTIPPDPILAVGPNHVMALVNSEFMIFDKQGTLLFNTEADAWFYNVLPSVDAFDPCVIYDQFAGRWVMLWDHWDGTDEAYWLISVSDDDNPMGTWCNYAFQANLNGMTNSNTWGDYPKLGYDDKALYASGRMFGYSGGFNYCKIRIIPKAQIYDLSCGPVDYTDFWDFKDPANLAMTVDGPPIAACHLDSPGDEAYFVVDAPYYTSSFITLWTIEDPLGASPIVTGVNIPTADAPPPPDADQLGGGSPRIDSGRRAYRNAVYQNGQIWTATAVGGGTANQYAFARYVRFHVNSQTLIEDVAFGADGYYYLYPSIMVDDENNMVMGFSRSGTDEYCGVYYTGRRNLETELAPSTMLKAGEANYVKTFSGTRNRWGDYMGIGQDPDDTSIIWALIEYADSPVNTWGSWVGAFGYQYKTTGTVTDAVSSDPIQLANLLVVETANTITTDTFGTYSFAAPSSDVTLNISAFAYQGTSIAVTMTQNIPEVVDVALQPEVTATFSGQVLDPATQEGVVADLDFYVEGNPHPGPYFSISTNGTGNFSTETIIGDYYIIAHPVSPYPTDVGFDDLVLDAGGLDIDLEVTPASVMLVDDDGGSDYESYFTDALLSLDVTYHLWSNEVNGEPSPADIGAYPDSIVVWYTGDGDSTLNASEITNLAGHLQNGGSLFMTGQNIAEQIDGSDLLNVLGISFLQNSTQNLVSGVSGSFAEGMFFSTSGSGGANNQTSRDEVEITNNTTTSELFFYGVVDSAVAGVAYHEGAAKAVHLGFGWEAIFNADKREEVMAAVLGYFDPGLGVEDSPPVVQLPKSYKLLQNYPNPFNPTTTIRFDLPENEGEMQDVTVVVYDMRGRRVRMLIDSDLKAGSHQVHWNGRNDRGESVASGIYMYTLKTGSERFTRKMTVLK